MMVTGFQIYLWQLIYRTGLPLHSLATVAAGTLRSGSRQEYSPHEPLGGTFTDDLIELDGRSGLL